MGRGRTTTGMVIATLLYLRKIEAFPVKKGKVDNRGGHTGVIAWGHGWGLTAVPVMGWGQVDRRGRWPLSVTAGRVPQLFHPFLHAEIVPAWFRDAMARQRAPSKESGLSGEERLKGGNYGAIRSLLRALDKVSRHC